MIENAMKRLNSLVKRINPGVDHSVFPRSGFAMVILIVLMEQMKILPFTIVQSLSPAVKINLLVRMVGASIGDGSVTTIMTAEMVQMRVNSAIRNIRRAPRMNSHARTSNV
uniref:Uncharacterized protein n=1 Tax=Phlebotomus papatasi TaxID=29031 RepID=A0A1B0D0B1_PHLPP